ncbi:MULTISPECIES: c-type cytochrome [unclassified Meiothermus]|uniref:c-type cytochrome n=1 Tax=unclassified Meiothermus TaxID=370471 RepID=UPI000D7C59E4|nr:MULTISPECIES: c-type cytochrome [unclassified Meiothermus]PZA08682.1 cystathionine beta-synthase [Meiothermus sp. Pnk-1]RYM40699.1 tetratricopeptide repeat protein [Meiothermus sp. PNK-Is4]
MTLILALLVLLAAIGYAMLPLRQAARPFPPNPRPEELQAELQLLKAQAKEAEGEERKRLLLQIVKLEREIGPLPGELPPPRRFPPALWGVAALGVIALGVGLYAFTLPRLPGETTVTARSEARELKRLEERAKQGGQTGDWLAFAHKAWELQDFDRAAQAYVRVLQQDPRNVEAVRRVGILLFMGGRPQEAVQFLQIALRADPKATEGWLFLGNAYFQLGQREAAIRAWENYLANGGEARERVQNLIATAKAQQSAPGASGQQVYLQKCAACHGAQAQGGVGPKLAGNPIVKVPQAVSEIVKNGRGKMPAVLLSDEELKALLEYLGGL